MGFGKKGKSSFTVQRSEEVLPTGETRGVLSRGSSASDDGEPLTVDGDRFDNENFRISFIEFYNFFVNYFWISFYNKDENEIDFTIGTYDL